MISPSALSSAVAPASSYSWLRNTVTGSSPSIVITGGVISLTVTVTAVVSSAPGVPSLMV